MKGRADTSMLFARTTVIIIIIIIDLKTLDNALKSESAELDFCQVYTPKSVLVSSSELVLNDTTLKQYFHRFENLGKITKLTPMDYGMMDVTFESHEGMIFLLHNRSSIWFLLMFLYFIMENINALMSI